MFGLGCARFQKVTNATVCEKVDFDYSDTGMNNTNARAMLSFYCLCKDDKVCKD